MEDKTKRIRNALNLGEKSGQMLAQAGINSMEQLRELGAVQAYLMVRDAGVPVSLNLLYAIHGALNDTHWNKLDRDTREALIMAVDAADAQRG